MKDRRKILYEGPEPGTLIQYYKDDGSATATPPQAAVEGKGVLEQPAVGILHVGSERHRRAHAFHSPHQHARTTGAHGRNHPGRGGRAQLCGRRIVQPSWAFPKARRLPRPIVEYYFKDDKLGNPMVAEEHIIAFGWASQQDLDDMVALALRVNDFMSGVMMGVGIRLADFRIEVGRIWEGDFMRLIVADEISPDSCRLWDLRGLEAPDREGLIREPGPLADVYTELARRLGVLPSNVTHTTKPTLIN